MPQQPYQPTRPTLLLIEASDRCMADHMPVSSDPTTRTGIILFFVILGVIVGSIALFLILKPV